MADRAGQGRGTIGLRNSGAKVEYEPPRPMGRWTVEATCPDCGGVLAHQADGRPQPTAARAIARCTGCGEVWMAEITLAKATSSSGHRPHHADGCSCRPCERKRAAA